MRKIGVILVSFVFVWGWVRPASAHTFATDGNITVLFHTNPDDDPIVGQGAALLFQISDSTGKFDSTNCDCNVAIAKDKNVLFSGSLLSVVGESVYGFTEPFTFPTKAVYQITVTGKPKQGNAFAPFQVEYDLRVDRGAGENPSSDTSSRKNNTWYIAAGLAIFAIIVGVTVYFIRYRKS